MHSRVRRLVGTVDAELVKEYVEKQEGEEIIDESRFPIDSL
jgi:hypothetical protein